VPQPETPAAEPAPPASQPVPARRIGFEVSNRPQQPRLETSAGGDQHLSRIPALRDCAIPAR
jgi:hypothetical protein